MHVMGKIKNPRIIRKGSPLLVSSASPKSDIRHRSVSPGSLVLPPRKKFRIGEVKRTTRVHLSSRQALLTSKRMRTFARSLPSEKRNVDAIWSGSSFNRATVRPTDRSTDRPPTHPLAFHKMRYSRESLYLLRDRLPRTCMRMNLCVSYNGPWGPGFFFEPEWTYRSTGSSYRDDMKMNENE